MRSAEYALIVIIGLVIIYLFVLTPVQEAANSLNNSAILIAEASDVR